MPAPLDRLRSRAQTLLGRARAPFSNAPVAAVALLDDGRWVPGVRLESASYSLTLSALQNAHTTVETAEDAPPLAALVLSRPARREERLYVDQLDASLHAVADDAWVRSAYARPQLLPVPTSPLPVPLDAPMDTEQSGIDMARRAAARAVVPASEFPVGAVFETEAGHLVPGANVEHSDWARILCAERNALGTVQSYALGPVKRGFLSCLEDAAGTPCGACRQWLAELASASHLWMDRHETSPERAAVSTLLPGSFRGRPLLDG